MKFPLFYMEEGANNIDSFYMFLKFRSNMSIIPVYRLKWFFS